MPQHSPSPRFSAIMAARLSRTPLTMLLLGTVGPVACMAPTEPATLEGTGTTGGGGSDNTTMATFTGWSATGWVTMTGDPSTTGATAGAGDDDGTGGTTDHTGSTSTDTASTSTDATSDSTSGSTSGSTSDASTSTSTSTDDSSTTTGEDPHIIELRIEPEQIRWQLDLGEAATSTFKALATLSDGSERDVSETASWSFSASFAECDGAQLSTGPYTAALIDHGWIRARVDALESGAASVLLVAADEATADTRPIIIAPHGDPDGPTVAMVTATPSISQADVFFAVDATGSMAGEIRTLANSLMDTIIPGITDEVPDVWFGAGSYRDFPITPFGSSADQPFFLDQALTANTSAVELALGAMAASGGLDVPESLIEALHQIATGAGLSGPGETFVEPNDEGLGGVGFRSGSLPFIFPITDAPTHAPFEPECISVDYNDAINEVAATREQVHAELGSLCAKVLPIVSLPYAPDEPCTAHTDGKSLSEASSAIVPPTAWASDRPLECPAGACCTGLNHTRHPFGYTVTAGHQLPSERRIEKTIVGPGIQQSQGLGRERSQLQRCIRPAIELGIDVKPPSSSFRLRGGSQGS